MNKKPQDMNVLAKFKVYSLFEDALRQGSGLRFMLLAALLALALPTRAADYVLTYKTGNTTYYLARNGTSGVQRVSTFNPTTCIWSCENSSGSASTLTNSTTYGWLYQSVGNTKYYLSSNGGTPTLVTNPSKTTGANSKNYTCWRTDETYLYNYYEYETTFIIWTTPAQTSYYINLASGAATATSSSGTCAIPYAITSSQNELIDNVTLPTISISSTAGNTITFGYDGIGGSYVPANTYTIYTFNNAAHNWYNSQDWGTAVPTGAAVLASSLSPTYTWSLTADGGGVASIDPSTGVLTINSAPTADITVRLTVGNISPLANKTVDFTLTRAAISEKVTSTTTITGPTLTPASAALYYNEGSQTFTATASATTVTSTTPAYTTLSGGGYTYYYYNGTLSNAAPSPNVVQTNPDVTLTWTLSGTAATNLSLSSATGASTTVTHTTQAPADRTATLTVTASAAGASNKQATATVTAYGPMAAPTISRTGNSVSLATASLGATIYYTTDGTTPSAGSTPYSGPFDLTTSPTTVKAIAIRDGHPSAVATQVLKIQLAPPTISIGATGLATLTAEDGATIHYTTDGSTPTDASPTYSDPVQLSNPQTIMAIAVRDGYDNSEVASDEYITGGVSGGRVILDDREDHNWTYYAGVDPAIDGGNYNTNYRGTLYKPNPRNVKITYRGNDGAVSVNESDTVFIYFKTLEEGTTTGQYPYTVISNPFSKRPSGKGFGGWKIKEGADYINGYADEATLPLDADIVFSNLPYTEVNGTSAEIVFEATWVNLNNITYANNNNITYNVSGGNYETNILVLNRNVTGTITTTSPVTIMMVEPDGSSDYRNTYTFTGNITPNNNGVTKIEFTRWNSTNTLTCNNHSVTVGRGMTTTSQCASYVTGVTGTTSNRQQDRTTYNANLNYHLKLESGTFTDVSFIAGTEGTAGYVNCSGTSNQVKGTLGNDYDRAKEDNTKLNITDELFLGYRPTYANGNQNNANFTCWVKSGNLGSGINVTNTSFNYQGNPNGGYYGDAGQLFYVSSGGAQTYIGKRKVYVEGGILAGIAGGIDENNNADDETFFVRMTGGQVRGVVYGCGAFAATKGIRRFIITGGTINGWVAAGCNGTDPGQSGGTLPSNTFVYIGGTAHIGNNTDLTLNTSTDGNVFGAGSGNSAQATTGQVNNSNVVVADQCYVKRNVYGGGNYGYSNATATVYVTGGQVAGSVFGGSNQKQGVTVNVHMTGGQVDNGVYGGSNTSGTISGTVTMTVNGGTVGNGTSEDGVYGGGYGTETRVNGNVSVTLGASTSATDSATVNGNVYGGSAKGQTNNGNANNTTTVTMNKALVNGNVFGGAFGNGAVVNGRITVNILGGLVNGNVFGGGDAAAYNKSGQNYPVVNMSGGKVRNIFGGGKGATATVTGNPQVTLSGKAHVTGNVYGGGDAAEVTGQTNVRLQD